jgi:RNA polymerase sigma factor (sigma-70 family)
MELPATKKKRYEDWMAVMQDLLEGNLERQALVYAKLNRQISIFLRKWDAWQYADKWEDLRQEAILKLTERFRKPPLPEPSAFFTYFETVTRNVLIDRIRKERGIMMNSRISGEEDEDPVADIPAPLPGLDDATRLSVQNCLEQLPPPLREVIEVRYIEDCKLEAAAQEIGHSLATFKRRLQTALELLRDCLSETLRRKPDQSPD